MILRYGNGLNNLLLNRLGVEKLTWSQVSLVFGNILLMFPSLVEPCQLSLEIIPGATLEDGMDG